MGLVDIEVYVVVLWEFDFIGLEYVFIEKEVYVFKSGYEIIMFIFYLEEYR